MIAHVFTAQFIPTNMTKLTHPIVVSLPNGQHISIFFTRQIPLIDNIVLDEVLYVPSFKFNLLSVSRLTRQLNYSISFSESNCYMQGCSLRKPLEIGSSQRGLYIFPSCSLTVSNYSTKSTISSSNSSSCVSNSQIVNTINCISSCNADAFLWHCRLGHLPMTMLKTLSICTVNADDQFFSDVCFKAKQHRLPFPHSKIHIKRKFELIHIDIWGPYKVSTYNHYKYFLTIADDYTRVTWTYPLSSKNNAFTFLKNFIVLVENQFNVLVLLDLKML